MRRIGPFLAILALCAAPTAARERGEKAAAGFPDPRPTTRAQAIETLLPDLAAAGRCLTPAIRDVSARPGPHVGHTLDLLHTGDLFSRDRVIYRHDGVIVRFPATRTGRGGEPLPEEVQAGLDGVDEAAELLGGRMQFRSPIGLEIVFDRLDSRLDGYSVDARGTGGRTRIVLNVAPLGGIDAIRRAAIHQYTHVTAERISGTFPSGWGEALATWAVMAIEGDPEAAVLEAFEHRLDRAADGWFVGDEDGAGDALLFDFVDRMYGPVTVRNVAEQLAARIGAEEAFRRGISAGTGLRLADTLREFHVWTTLTGSRATGHHFPYAARLRDGRAASEHEGLPALSIHSDAPVEPWGTTQVRLLPETDRGGLELYFEGEIGARWEADLLLFDRRGRIRRVPVELSDGDGDNLVPLEDVDEVLLLVRHLGGDDAVARAYTFAAHHDPVYPVEIAQHFVEAIPDGGGGNLVTWETVSERDLVGFNVLRRHPGSTTAVTVNPVWIPALGEPDFATSYSFVDPDAHPGVDYEYRIEAITRDGLTATSDGFLPRLELD